jgi:hypothetical protein
LLFGGEKNAAFDFRYYNFVIYVPRKIYNEYAEGSKISKRDLMELLKFPHRAETKKIDVDKLDTKTLLDFAVMEDMENMEQLRYINESLVNNTMHRETLNEEKRNDFAALLLLMMLLHGSR